MYELLEFWVTLYSYACVCLPKFWGLIDSFFEGLVGRGEKIVPDFNRNQPI